jgi:peroxiredoxin
MIAGFVFIALLFAATWLLLYHLLRQQGRLLLRLDAVERRLSLDGQAAVRDGLAPSGVLAERYGVLAETPVAPFAAPGLDGRLVTLEAFRGKPVLLVNWSPACGYCQQIAPKLARLQPALAESGVQLLFVSRGDAASNRQLAEEHDIRAPILLPDAEHPVEVFGTYGTPVAYLLDAQGRLARPVAIGADQVPLLAQQAAATTQGKKTRLPGERPLSESRIERNGLKVGTPAPNFSLPDLQGSAVSLATYRGRRVLLVFSDPHCGPCNALIPELVGLHRRYCDDGLAIVLVGRGDAAENRREVAEHGVKFPVVLQARWELSRQYGIFETPVAFLVDEQGVIARDVARGPTEILALAAKELAPARKA